MSGLIDCWKLLKQKDYRHADKSEVLSDKDLASMKSLAKDHVGLGANEKEAALRAVQSHLDEVDAQLNSVYDQVGVKEAEPAPPAEPPVVTPETPAADLPYTGEGGAPPTEPPVTPFDTSDAPHVSSIANRFVKERATKGEVGQVIPGQGASTQELVHRGLKMSPEEVNQHVSDLMNDTGDIVKQGQAVRAEEARLSQRSSELSKSSESNPNDLNSKVEADNAFKDLTDFHNGPIAKLKNKWHKAGMEMQGEIPVDLGSFNGLREAWLRDTGKAPPKSVESTLRKTANNVTKSVEQEKVSMSKLGQEIDRVSRRSKLPTPEQVRDNIINRMKRQPCP